MVRAGISLPALQHLMGHSQIHTTLLYVQLAPTDVWREYARAVANRSRFGNAASVFTSDGRSARAFVQGIEAGMVGVNIGVPAPAATFPFVGWKGSVFGGHAATGPEAVAFYTRTKVVTSRWF